MKKILMVSLLATIICCSLTVGSFETTIKADGVSNESTEVPKTADVPKTKWEGSSWWIKDGTLYISGGATSQGSESNPPIPWAKYCTEVKKIKITATPENKLVLSGNCLSLFGGFLNLESIDGLENVDTSGVTNFAYMFEYNWDLTELDLTSFKRTSEKYDTDEIFINTYRKLNTIKIGDDFHPDSTNVSGTWENTDTKEIENLDDPSNKEFKFGTGTWRRLYTGKSESISLLSNMTFSFPDTSDLSVESTYKVSLPNKNNIEGDMVDILIITISNKWRPPWQQG